MLVDTVVYNGGMRQQTYNIAGGGRIAPYYRLVKAMLFHFAFNKVR